MRKLSGIFHLITENLFIDAHNVSSFEDNTVKIQILGEIYCEDSFNDFSLIKKYYNFYKRNISEYIEGIYLLSIYDKVSKELLIIQDNISSPFTIYYTNYNNRVFYSTDLKSLLLKSQIPRRLHIELLDEFLTYGFIKGHNTLIKNIYKLQPSTGLLINSHGIEEIKLTYNSKTILNKNSQKKLQSTLPINLSNYSDDKCINLLSTNDNSKYIINSIKNTNKPINIFTTNSNQNTFFNEYNNIVNLFNNTSSANTETIQNFTDIVWCLEGSMYYYDLFSQYELLKSAKRSGVNSLISDGSLNEIMLIKGHEILSNSMDINITYPLLNHSIINILYKKRFIKKKLKNIDKDNLLSSNNTFQNIDSMYNSLFKSNDEINILYNKLEQSHIYTNNKSIIDKLINTRFYKKFKSKNNNLKFQENKLQKYLGILYIIIFDKLFISGKYDYLFLSPRIKIKLNDLI